MSLTDNGIHAFGVLQPSTLEVDEIESIGDIYPGLDLGDLPGSAIRYF